MLKHHFNKEVHMNGTGTIHDRSIYRNMVIHARSANTRGVFHEIDRLSPTYRNLIMNMFWNISPDCSLNTGEKRKWLAIEITRLHTNVKLPVCLQDTSIVYHILSFCSPSDIGRANQAMCFSTEIMVSVPNHINTINRISYADLECYRRFSGGSGDYLPKLLKFRNEKSGPVVSLDFSNKSLDNDLLGPILRSCTSLTNLNLANCNFLTNRIINDFPETLTSINLAGCNWVTPFALGELKARCKQLRQMDLSNCHNGVLTEGLVAGSLPKQLTELNLTSCYWVSNLVALPHLLRAACPDLRSITVSNCRITPEWITTLAQQYTSQLVYIDFTYCQAVRGGAALVSLAINCPNLEKICLSSSFTSMSHSWSNLAQAEVLHGISLFAARRSQVQIIDDHGKSTNNTYQNTLDRFREALRYGPRHSLAQLYCRVLNQSSNEEIDVAVRGMDLELRNKIYFHVWKLSGEQSGTGWGEWHALDNKGILLWAIEESIRWLLHELPETQRNRVYGQIYEMADSPNQNDPQWGEHHARDNYARLADAIHIVSRANQSS